jgi:putative oxidoreductase
MTKPTNAAHPLTGSARRRAITIGLWLIQLILAVQFAGAGLFKLSAAPVMVEMFTTIGIGQWFRVLVGTLELAGAIGLLVPRLAGLAALGLAGVMLGAIFANLLILGAAPWLPMGLLLCCALVVWSRWPQLRQVLQSVWRR